MILLVVTLLVALGSGAALAKAFEGTNGPDDIAGTKKAYKVGGRAGNDSLRGDRGGDKIVGGPGADRVFGDPGNDTIDVADGEQDEVVCGEGENNKVVFDSDLDAAAPGTPSTPATAKSWSPKGAKATNNRQIRPRGPGHLCPGPLFVPVERLGFRNRRA